MGEKRKGISKAGNPPLRGPSLRSVGLVGIADSFILRILGRWRSLGLCPSAALCRRMSRLGARPVSTRKRPAGAPMSEMTIASMAARRWLMASTAGTGGNRSRQRCAGPCRHDACEIFAPVPDVLVLDHDCGNRTCTRTPPDHLEPVTSAETVIRSDEFMAVHDRKTNWPQGDPLQRRGPPMQTQRQRRGRHSSLP